MSDSTVKTQGQVKWFNNKSGYGFISVKMGDETKDIFAHYSNIVLNESHYKYLTQGEYVEFDLSKIEDKPESEHEFQAVNITGIGGGPIMCEVRRLNRESRDAREPTDSRPRAPPPRRRRRETDDEGFNTVRKSVSRR
tara:strand:- start:1021 stop:1434 length:414 start_codon:yes stop_codon:yes gene_type:complete